MAAEVHQRDPGHPADAVAVPAVAALQEPTALRVGAVARAFAPAGPRQEELRAMKTAAISIGFIRLHGYCMATGTRKTSSRGTSTAINVPLRGSFQV